MQRVYLLWQQTTWRSERCPDLQGVFASPQAAKKWYDDIGHISAMGHTGPCDDPLCKYCKTYKEKWDGIHKNSVKYEDDDVYYHVWIETEEVNP